MHQNQPENLLTVAEACERLRISKPTLNRHFRGGALPRVKIGHRTLIRERDVSAFIDRSVQLPAAA